MALLTPDLLVVCSSSIDFPLWRQLVRNQRHRFAQVILATYHTGAQPDLVSFFQHTLDGDGLVIDIGRTPAQRDWRDVAVNHGLQAISPANPWILFMEQDFLVPDPEKFFGRVFNPPDGVDVIGFVEGGEPWNPRHRLHPAFTLVRRDLVELTSKDFAAHPDDLGVDHFGVFSAELHQLGARLATLQELGLKEDQDWTHLAGCTQNYTLMTDPAGPNYQPQAFQEYLRATLRATVPLHPLYVERVLRYLEHV